MSAEHLLDFSLATGSAQHLVDFPLRRDKDPCPVESFGVGRCIQKALDLLELRLIDANVLVPKDRTRCHLSPPF
jgi:hypothetical protein